MRGRSAMAGVALTSVTALVLACGAYAAECDGFLINDGQRLFPLGFYELPESDEGLKAMANAGVNLVRCRNRADLDRLHALGMQGVMPLPLEQGPTEEFRARVAEVADHPALAVWEGPDEVVWNYTAFSGLFRTMGVYKTREAWWEQAPEARAYAAEQAAKLVPNMRAAAAVIRELDALKRPVWINEAKNSDVYYVRQYLDFVDITGCDYYPVHEDRRNIAEIAGATERWNQIGRGMPVYMVLQAFSWHELGEYYDAKNEAYPTFDESRFMAYDAIVHGADGILYWGSSFLKSEACRASIYALTKELAALQPFLTAPDVPGVRLSVIEDKNPDMTPRVAGLARCAGDDWLVVLVNEDDVPHTAVIVEGLEALNGRTLCQLYTEDAAVVARGELIARLQPKAVQVYVTSRDYEACCGDARAFGRSAEGAQSGEAG
ncbi:MAG TPA: hypothetical protein PLB67_08495 [Candidatus Hydrogenedentes bacterium]|nr:hypothetical protein [Candidatus Hydrogenedentota bacterium]MDY0033373.1 hypothetical protein [FCB group bacterium]NLT59138.1 hypothetical protein [Candidatus Hydrogenedentota bacterium]HNZ19827.1 hypothetical protein [Candidatus Hydrogenedentota bacterium]HOH35134.1 hypothetical protein [Candidatus Hydrogenedentota bacterium]